MLALANMMHFLAYEFSGLRRRRLSFLLIAVRSFDGFFIGH